MNLYHDIKNLQHSAPLFFHTGCCWLHCKNWMVFFQFFINHLATSSATCTVKIVNKNWRQSVVYGSGGGGSNGGSTELHIHRADTRELTAKSSWFCHLLHVSLVGVVAVRTALAPTSNLLQPRTTRAAASATKHTHCAMPWLCSSVASVYTTLRLGYIEEEEASTQLEAHSLYSLGSQPRRFLLLSFSVLTHRFELFLVFFGFV